MRWSLWVTDTGANVWEDCGQQQSCCPWSFHVFASVIHKSTARLLIASYYYKAFLLKNVNRRKISVKIICILCKVVSESGVKSIYKNASYTVVVVTYLSVKSQQQDQWSVTGSNGSYGSGQSGFL